MVIKQKFKKIIVRALIVCSFVIMFYVWFMQLNAIENDINESRRISSDMICSKIEVAFKDEMFALSSMCRTWENNNGTKREDWDKEAFRIVKHFHFQAVEWVDGTTVRWIMPIEGNERAQGLDLSFEKNRDDAIVHSRGKKEESIGGPLDLVQGGIGLIVFAPIYENDEVIGFNVGVIRTKDHFEKIFDDYGDKYGIKISAGGRELYSTPAQYKDIFIRKVLVNNFTFDVEISHRQTLSTNLKFLGMGILLVLLIWGKILYVSLKLNKEKINIP